MHPLFLISLVGCAVEPQPETPSALADAQLPPMGWVTLSGPDHLVQGYDATFTVDGTIGYGEPVYIVGSGGAPGAGPCPAALGGQCLEAINPRILTSALYTGGPLEIAVPMPPNMAPGTTLTFQAVVIRGRRGSESVISAATSGPLEAPAFGCTDDLADNYDGAANLDDGSCTYTAWPCDSTHATITTQADVALYANCSTLDALYIQNSSGLTTVSLPELLTVHRYVFVAGEQDLVGVSLPALETVGGYVYIDGNQSLTTINTPSLASIAQYAYVTNNPSLNLWNAGSLASIGEYSYIAGNSNFCAEAAAPWSLISAAYAYVAGNLPCVP